MNPKPCTPKPWLILVESLRNPSTLDPEGVSRLLNSKELEPSGFRGEGTLNPKP